MEKDNLAETAEHADRRAARRLKVCYIITKSNFGGAQRYVHELATTAAQDGHDVLVALGGNGILAEKLAEDGIRTVCIEGFQRDINVLKELRSVAELWRLYRRERPDIVHCNSSKAVVLGALVGRFARIPRIVSTIHGWPFLERRNLLWRTAAWVGSWIGACASHAVIVVSHFDAAQRMPFCANKTTVIHTAVPDIAFQSRESARAELFDQETRIGHIDDLWLVTNGELTQNKNLFVALDAVRTFNTTHDQKIFYTIISDGELREALQSYIEKNGIASQVTLLGYVENARAYMPAFDLFLLPSKKEGFPYVILEAGAAGVPVIASRVGGIPEVIIDGESGLLTDPADPTTITAALDSMMDTDTRRAYADRLKSTVREQFSFDRMYRDTMTVYRHFENGS